MGQFQSASQNRTKQNLKVGVEGWERRDIADAVPNTLLISCKMQFQTEAASQGKRMKSLNGTGDLQMVVEEEDQRPETRNRSE